MKWYYYLFLILIIVLSALSIYRAVTPQNYNDKGVSFNYPGTWTKMSLNGSENSTGGSKGDAIALTDPNSAQNIVVIVQITKKSGTTDEIVAASKADLQRDWNATMLSDNIITVDGRQAHEIIYTTDPKVNKKERMVFFDKNDMLYCIVLGSSAPAFDSQKNNFDMIVNSFKVTN